VASLVVSTAGCSFSRPIEEQHPSVQRAPASDGSGESRLSTALRTAAGDLGCEQVSVVLVLERRYANTSAPRYVIEGCGKRGLYAETCEDYPHCRYLLLSMVPVPGAGDAPATSPGAPLKPGGQPSRGQPGGLPPGQPGGTEIGL